MGWNFLVQAGRLHHKSPWPRNEHGDTQTLARYKAAFMVSVVCLLLVLRRRLSHAVALAFCGAVPIVASGLVAQAQGWHFLSNSILLKGRAPSHSLAGVLQAAKLTAVTLLKQQCILVLLIAVLVVLVLLCRQDRRGLRPVVRRVWRAAAAVAGGGAVGDSGQG